MSVEIGTEAAQFPEKEYINEIFVARGEGLGVARLCWHDGTNCRGCD